MSCLAMTQVFGSPTTTDSTYLHEDDHVKTAGVVDDLRQATQQNSMKLRQIESVVTNLLWSLSQAQQDGLLCPGVPASSSKDLSNLHENSSASSETKRPLLKPVALDGNSNTCSTVPPRPASFSLLAMCDELHQNLLDGKSTMQEPQSMGTQMNQEFERRLECIAGELAASKVDVQHQFHQLATDLEVLQNSLLQNGFEKDDVSMLQQNHQALKLELERSAETVQEMLSDEKNQRFVLQRNHEALKLELEHSVQAMQATLSDEKNDRLLAGGQNTILREKLLMLEQQVTVATSQFTQLREDIERACMDLDSIKVKIKSQAENIECSDILLDNIFRRIADLESAAGVVAAPRLAEVSSSTSLLATVSEQVDETDTTLCATALGTEDIAAAAAAAAAAA
mmetsp:Transcript_72174/g.139471  ORF Transcript_72174/g.139471 Transcript_72174/m.139471 type:complete len:397 (+) Transcript_72174:24-1214(+)